MTVCESRLDDDIKWFDWDIKERRIFFGENSDQLSQWDRVHKE